MNGVRALRARPLTCEDFAPFGDVIETAGHDGFTINQGTATRYHDLARVDVTARGGRAAIGLVRAQPQTTPVPLRLMERHPLASQAFIPLGQYPFLVVVARPGPAPDQTMLHAFVSNGHQGINYHKGVWHHPLIALGAETDFVVVDRQGPGDNCDEAAIQGGTVTVTL